MSLWLNDTVCNVGGDIIGWNYFYDAQGTTTYAMEACTYNQTTIRGTYNTHIRCCDSLPCTNIVTACDHTKMYYSNTYYNCTGPQTCASERYFPVNQPMYTTSTVDSTIMTVYYCASETFPPRTGFVTLDGVFSTACAPGVPDVPAAYILATPTQAEAGLITKAPSLSSAASSSTSPPKPSPTAGSGSMSNTAQVATIIGSVVGPAVAIASILVTIWLARKKRAERRAAVAQGDNGDSSGDEEEGGVRVGTGTGVRPSPASTMSSFAGTTAPPEMVTMIPAMQGRRGGGSTDQLMDYTRG